LGVKGRVRAPGWDLEDRKAIQSLTWACTNQTTSLIVRSWNTMVHERTTGKPYSQNSSRPGFGGNHNLVVYFVLGHGTSTQMSFCPGTLKWESRNSHNWDFCDFGGP
jgi:hypothetical protein